MPPELVYTDVVGPFEEISQGSSKYFITIHDDFNAISIARFLQSRSDTADNLKCVILGAEHANNSKVKKLTVTYL